MAEINHFIFLHSLVVMNEAAEVDNVKRIG
jgi:hypothetical protein